jgi:hypothetical protein
MGTTGRVCRLGLAMDDTAQPTLREHAREAVRRQIARTAIDLFEARGVDDVTVQFCTLRLACGGTPRRLGGRLMHSARLPGVSGPAGASAVSGEACAG